VTRRISDLKGADPYALLEISPAATADDIQRAYRKVMRQAHPDMVTGDEDRTKLLNIARDVLLDPDLRAEYDRRALGVPSEPVAPRVSAWDAEDIVIDDRPPVHPVYSPPYRQPYSQPVYVAAPGDGIGLGVWALIAAILCFPLGAMLGVVALMREPKPHGANKVCAIVAVCWGGIASLCCLGLTMFGTSLNTFGGG